MGGQPSLPHRQLRDASPGPLGAPNELASYDRLSVRVSWQELRKKALWDYDLRGNFVHSRFAGDRVTSIDYRYGAGP